MESARVRANVMANHFISLVFNFLQRFTFALSSFLFFHQLVSVFSGVKSRRGHANQCDRCLNDAVFIWNNEGLDWAGLGVHQKEKQKKSQLKFILFI